MSESDRCRSICPFESTGMDWARSKSMRRPTGAVACRPRGFLKLIVTCRRESAAGAVAMVGAPPPEDSGSPRFRCQERDYASVGSCGNLVHVYQSLQSVEAGKVHRRRTLDQGCVVCAIGQLDISAAPEMRRRKLMARQCQPKRQSRLATLVWVPLVSELVQPATASTAAATGTSASLISILHVLGDILGTSLSAGRHALK